VSTWDAAAQGHLAVAGHRLEWRSVGPPGGPSVVLLHSGLGSLHDWRAVAPALVAAGWRVVAYDRWGYGGSDPRPGFAPPDFEPDQADLAAVLDRVVGGPAALIGHSDGGTIALTCAARAPERVTRLVAVAAHAYVELKMRPGIAGIAARYDGDSRFREAFARRHGTKAEALARSWFAGWTTREAWAWDMRPELGAISCPTLVLQGFDDEHATAQHARDIADAIRGAELVLLPDAGHMLPQEATDAFLAHALAFLAPLSDASAR